MGNDPLAKLLIDKKESNRQIIADILNPFARIDKETGTIVYTPQFSKLAIPKKVMIFLLSRKAAVMLGLPIKKEEVSSYEISKESGIKYGTVRVTVLRLEKNRLLAKNGEKYFIPDYAVHLIKEMIEKEKKK